MDGLFLWMPNFERKEVHGMSEQRVTREVQVEERPALQERFCEVPPQEVASSAAESDRSREAWLAMTLGFVP
jgi:hypothetical protein